MDNNINNNNVYNVSKKEIITPIISMVAFLLLLVGASYAYYTNGGTGSAANVGANVQLPARCIASVSTNSTCSASLTQAQMTTANVGSSNVSNCAITVTVNGNKNCTCSYVLNLTPSVSGAYATANYVANSVTYQITGSGTVAETNIAVGWTGTKPVLSSQSVTVATTGTAVSKTYYLNLKMYNRNADQDKMASKAFGAILEATPTCSIATA